MGASKRNLVALTTTGPGRFSADFVQECEAEGCLHFALAMARLTGWPVLAVEGTDRVKPDIEETDTVQVRRLVCANDRLNLFDPTGIFPVDALLRQRAESLRRPGDAGLAMLPLSEPEIRSPRVQLPRLIDESVIERHADAIRANRVYLQAVPPRPWPWLAADLIRRYAFGKCFAFAEALVRERGGVAVAMVATTPLRDAVRPLGGEYLHAVALLEDGTALDAWGARAPRVIADRYNMGRFTLSQERFEDEMRDARAVRARDLEAEIAAAQEVVRRYWGSGPGFGGTYPDSLLCP